MICERCKRPVQTNHNRDCASGKPAAYIKVVHEYYGCDTGCDGQEPKEFALEIAHDLLEIYKVPLNEMECVVHD